MIILLKILCGVWPVGKSCKFSGVVAGGEEGYGSPTNWDLPEIFGNFTLVGKTSRSSASNYSFYDDDLLQYLV